MLSSANVFKGYLPSSTVHALENVKRGGKDVIWRGKGGSKLLPHSIEIGPQHFQIV